MENIDKFLQLAESLKLVRKAEIENSCSENIIDEIYTDLLPNNAILGKVNLPRTSILIGRKGTGKSTIFQKSIKDVSQNKKCIPIYIDVKTLYDTATPTLSCMNDNIISNEEILKYLLYKNFLKSIILETKKKLNNIFINKNFLSSLLGINENKRYEVEKVLHHIETRIDTVFKSIDGSIISTINNSLERSSEEVRDINGSISTAPQLSIEAKNLSKEGVKQSFSKTFLNYLNIKESLIENLIKIKAILGLKYLYIYLDDYSEIDEEAQILFMDWFIAPLNNLSEDFIKFKIATYPKRFYYGKLDNQKIDEIPLDFYDVYYTYKNISKMEELALKYTIRLIDTRSKVFLPNDNFVTFFDLGKDELFETLFDVSLNIPRKIGYILSYCYESHLIHNQKITKAAISNAAVRYYNEVIKKYFESNRHVIKSFEDKISIENQKELVIKVTNKQITNKKSIEKSKAKQFKLPNPPTSHFIINNELGSLLDSIELNGYITTYNKVNDKNNIPSTLYALDYGLCHAHNLNYGRPKDATLRKYYNETRFNFNSLVREHLNQSQIIKCENGHEFKFDLLENFKAFDMQCPTCLQNKKFSICRVETSSFELTQKIREYDEVSLKLDDITDYNILDFMNEHYPISYYSTEIGPEIDCSWQLIIKRANKLVERGLLEIDEEKSQRYNKRYFKLTIKAKDLLTKSITI
jgi:hypothetical protein